MADINDATIEANTHQIRKQFYDAIQEIEQQGQDIENVEAFLISTNDLHKLQEMFHGSSGFPPDSNGQMKMCGVKIIESHHIPDGTIFKVFKNEEQMVHPVSLIPKSIDVSVMGQAGSYIIPTPPMPEQNVTEKQDEKETEPVDTRHSTKRRIELDE